MTTLFNLAAEVRAATSAEELDDAAVERLESLGLDLDEKVNSYCRLIRESEGRQEARRKEIKRLQAANGSEDEFCRDLRDRMREALTMMGQKRHRTTFEHVIIKASPPRAVALVEPGFLPPKFQRVKIEANAAAAIEEWRATGKAPEGFEVTVGTHLEIR